ncbi:MAG: hypothetical protein GAK28_03214 [Luteibacter sp.]|uniref:hypothetical protein n=1 Tax=Luteibacter sp. TaxID=1886636 RepID=UPI001381B708|nr:hypothetical protein [Luteibacter sp.]KAF1005462.1 MAG: hypothetical protein GAK28_03214 [Luteibacter sp.]
MSQRAIRVVAPKAGDGVAQSTMGTKVILPDGSAMPGVTRVVLVGDVGKPWVAHITCHVQYIDLTAELKTTTKAEPGATDGAQVDVTSIGDEARKWEIRKDGTLLCGNALIADGVLHTIINGGPVSFGDVAGQAKPTGATEVIDYLTGEIGKAGLSPELLRQISDPAPSRRSL